MDTEELFELGTRLGLSGDDLEQWVLEEQRYWREENELELESLKKIAEMEKARAAIEKEREEHVRARVEIEKETFQLRLRLAELKATRRNTSQSEDGTETYDRVILFAPPTSSTDLIMLPLKGVQEVTQLCELVATKKCQRALYPDRNTETSEIAEAPTSNFIVRGSVEPEVKDAARTIPKSFLPPEQCSVTKKSSFSDETVLHPQIAAKCEKVVASTKDPISNTLRQCLGRPKGRTAETKKKGSMAMNKGKVHPIKPSRSERKSTGTTKSSCAHSSQIFDEFALARLAGALKCKSNPYTARRWYVRGREWHRSHCRKRKEMFA